MTSHADNPAPKRRFHAWACVNCGIPLGDINRYELTYCEPHPQPPADAPPPWAQALKGGDATEDDPDQLAEPEPADATQPQVDQHLPGAQEEPACGTTSTTGPPSSTAITSSGVSGTEADGQPSGKPSFSLDAPGSSPRSSTGPSATPEALPLSEGLRRLASTCDPRMRRTDLLYQAADGLDRLQAALESTERKLREAERIRDEAIKLAEELADKRDDDAERYAQSLNREAKALAANATLQREKSAIEAERDQLIYLNDQGGVDQGLTPTLNEYKMLCDRVHALQREKEEAEAERDAEIDAAALERSIASEANARAERAETELAAEQVEAKLAETQRDTMAVEVDCLTAALAGAREAKDEAYSERNRVVAALARLFPSGIRKTNIPGWGADWHGCVYIDLPTGQISYHYHDSEEHLFISLPPYDKPFDGHDKDTVHARLRTLPSPTSEKAECEPKSCAVRRRSATRDERLPRGSHPLP